MADFRATALRSHLAHQTSKPMNFNFCGHLSHFPLAGSLRLCFVHFCLRETPL
jgi:hypothetical protein